MEKQAKIFIQLSTGLLVCIVAAMALFLFSCKKEEMPEATLPTYNVTFDSKGGSAVSAITVKAGDTLTLSVGSTKAGFTFGGWYADKEANTTPFSATTTIIADLTLYAKWNAVSPAVFSLSSIGFTDGGEIPPKYAYRDREQADRLNVSPQLSWANAPAGTTSFLIIMQIDGNDNKYDNYELFNQPNWYVYNIPAGKNSLAENEPSIRRNSCYYIGPIGLEGEKLPYQITIYALNLPENYFNFKDSNVFKHPPKTKAEAEEQLGSHILASASIKGTFARK